MVEQNPTEDRRVTVGELLMALRKKVIMNWFPVVLEA
jgi:hypothetical protein